MFNNATALFDVQVVAWIVGVVFVFVTTAIQKLSKTYKPWSWIAEQFGKAINKEMLDKIDAISEKVCDLEAADRKQDKERYRQLAIDSRRRILGVADEIRKGVRHSEEYFNEALEDVSNYRNYCRDNPDFENSKSVISSKIIEETYQQCLLEDDFD